MLANASKVALGATAATIGGWELVRPLGSGAWTEVFRARPVGSPANAPADYALKRLVPQHQNERLAIASLQREAYLAQRVGHPHLATVLLAHVDEPPYYLVSPYLAGTTLAKALERSSSLPLPHALWILRQVTEALRTLHDAGWVHLDVSPANIVVAPSGHATLIDLGLACKFDEPSKNKSIAGTPAYMAPELFQASATISPAADVYSLGVLLYQLLVGTLPFEDDDPLELVNAHLETPPPALRQKLPHVPSRVARLVKRMLAKEPLRRPATAELLSTLATLEIDTFSERLVA